MERRQFLGAMAAAMAAAPALAQPKPAPGPAKLKGRIKQGLWKVNFGADTQLSKGGAVGADRSAIDDWN